MKNYSDIDFWTNAEKVSDFFRIGSSERLTLSPVIASFINNLNPTSLLDFGCGDGYIHTLLNRGIVKYIYDINPEILDATAEKLRDYNCNPLKDEHEIASSGFDLVLLSLVMVCVPTLKEQKHILSTIKSSLKSDGKLIFVDPHPCFRQYWFRPFHTSFSQDKFEYMKQGTPFTVFMHEGHSEKNEITDFHIPLSSVIKLFSSMGFNLEKMIEVPDADLNDGNTCNKQFPPFNIFIYNLNN